MEYELTLDLRELIGMVKKRWLLIASITIISTSIAVFVNYRIIEPVYQSKCTIFVGKDLSMGDGDYNSSDIAMYHKLMATYAEIACSRDVADRAENAMYDEVSSSEIRNGLSVSTKDENQIMSMSMQSYDPELAKEMLDAVIVGFFEKAKEIYPEGNTSIIDKPRVQHSPISPNKKMNVAVAFCLGIMVSVGLVFLIEFMDNTIKKEEEIEKYLGIPVIGVIPEYNAKK